MERKTLYLIRHGESTYNALGIIQGQIDAPLTEKGRKNAGIVADKILQFEIGYIVASPLARAQETAEIINEKLNLPMTIYRDLQEMYFGEWAAEAKVEHWDQYRHAFYQDGMAPPGGESKRELFERARHELIKVCMEIEENPILVVTHGMVMRVLFGEWFTNSSEKEIRDLHMPNLAMYKVEVKFDSKTIEPTDYKLIEFL